MSSQIIEITEPGYFIKKHRGFLEIWKNKELIGSVVLDDMLAVIFATPGNSITTNLIDALSKQSIPLVFVDSHYLPTCITFSVSGNSGQFKIMQSQAKLREPRRKQAWKSIVQAKISNQGELIKRIGKSNSPFLRLMKRVKSGDPENLEAQAARLYWRNLFHENFRRDREKPGLNMALNYSYSVLRATVARGICAAGLHPSFSLHHKNPRNPINLVDDLIEPFRPLVDWRVRNLNDLDNISLDVDTKRYLANIASLPSLIDNEVSPLSVATVKMARSFGKYCMGDTNELLLPSLATEIEMAAS